MPLLEITGLHKAYNGDFKIRPVDISLEKGKILALLGPSGCGKTSLLRIIAGLETADGGTIRFNGKDITRLPPHKRGFGMMFQEYALFPHKNVGQNIAFGLGLQKLSHDQIQSRMREVLDLVGLSGFETRRIDDLSGGERQRVALARSLAPEPGLLMLDEPLAALDRNLRERLSADLRAILTRAKATAIFVTHDQVEAFTVAHLVGVMDAGRILQTASPEDLYKHPACEKVARFLGFQNLLAGTVLPDGRVDTPMSRFHPPDLNMLAGTRVFLVLRPEAAALSQNPDAPFGGISGQVTFRQFRGGVYRMGVSTGIGPDLVFHLPNHPIPPQKGSQIHLDMDPAGLAVMPEK